MMTDARACAIAWQAFKDRSPLVDSPEAAFKAGWQLSNAHHARTTATLRVDGVGPATSDDIARLVSTT